MIFSLLILSNLLSQTGLCQSISIGKSKEDSEKEKVFVGGTIEREYVGAPVFVTEDAKLTETKIKEIDGVKVTVKTYTYENIKPIYDEVLSCNREQDDLTIANNDFDYGFDEYMEYSLAGKVFGYYINHWYFEPEDKREVGAGNINIYLKDEEFGSFKLSCSDVTDLKKVPDWIKTLAKK